MPHKIEEQKGERQNENLFFQKLTSENREPELWQIAPEGELAVDVYETKKDIVVKAAIAGIKADDLTLSLENDLLTIRGKREDHDHSPRTYLCQECHWGPFSRSIILPTNTKIDKVKAMLQKGILTIILPKAKKEAEIAVQDLGD